MGGWWQALLANPDALDALIGGLATIAAAVLATLTGVLTYWLTQKRESLQAYAATCGIDLSTGIANVVNGTQTALEEARQAIAAAMAAGEAQSNDGANRSTHGVRLRSGRNIVARKGK